MNILSVRGDVMRNCGRRIVSTAKKPWVGWSRLITLLVFFGFGILVGFLFSLYIRPTSLLSDFLCEYCEALKNDELRISLFFALWDCIKWPFLIVLLSPTILGLAGIPLLFAIRGFLLTFSICTFSRLLGGEGLALAAAMFSVTTLLVLPAMFILGCDCLQASARHLPNLPQAGTKIFHVETYLVCAGILMVSATFQWLVIPSALSELCKILF
jgi:hypothetical protein